MANEGKYFDEQRVGYFPGGIDTPYPDHNMASEYISSGVPFVFYKSVGTVSADSVITITLPYVSRWIKLSVVSSAGTCRVGFGDVSGSKGVQGANYITAPVMTAITTPLELKCKIIKIFVPSGQNDCVINLVAGLTNVRTFPPVEITEDLTGITQEAAVTGTATVAAQAAIYSIAAA